MISFIRFIGAVAVVFSLGLMVSAMPIERIHLVAPTGIDLVSRLCAKLVLEGKLEAKLKALRVYISVMFALQSTDRFLVLCKNSEDLKIQIAILVALFENCAVELSKIGAGVVIVDAKAGLVACIVSTITVSTLSGSV
jgi:hypothetical protein